MLCLLNESFINKSYPLKKRKYFFINYFIKSIFVLYQNIIFFAPRNIKLDVLSKTYFKIKVEIYI